MKLHFFLESPDHVHNSFVLYVGYARFSYSDVFKGLASRESLFFGKCWTDLFHQEF